MSKLPMGWAVTNLGELADFIMGQAPPGPECNFDGVGTPFVKAGEFGAERPIIREWTTKPLKMALSTDVLMCVVGATCGKLNLGADCAIGRSVAAIRPSQGLEQHYLYALLKPLVLSLRHGSTGSAQGVISKDHLAQIDVPLPPFAEQRRIVAKLAGLTARTARARADLNRIPALASRYKQAVLAKAFSGELTAEWRAGRPNLKPAHAIRAAVLESWEASQAPTSRRRGPIADPQAGRQPVALGSLPDIWAQMDLASVTDPNRLIQYGILKPGDHINGGVPYVKVMNVKGGVVQLEKIRRTTAEIHNAYRRSSLREGDLLLTIRGTVGRLAEVPAELDGGNITQDSVRIALLPGVSRRFVYWFLHSPAAQEYFRANQKGVAVRGINVGDVRPMEIPVCSLEEQEEIVRRVDHAMVEIDRLAAEAGAGRRLLDHLDQSVLAKAFRGDLVPQDPTEEAAGVLLDRIRADRVASPKTARGQRRAVA